MARRKNFTHFSIISILLFLLVSIFTFAFNAHATNCPPNALFCRPTPGSTPTPPPTRRNCNVPTGDQIDMFGDSNTVGAKAQLEEAIPGIRIHAQDGKTFDRDVAEGSGGKSGMTLLREQTDLRRIIIFALGGNGGDVTAAKIATLVSEAGADRTIILMTMYGIEGSNNPTSERYTNMNNAVREAASTYDNVFVADWYNAVNADPTQYVHNNDDLGVHITAAGRDLYAQLFKDTVTENAVAIEWDPNAPRPTELRGTTNPEKTWNYFLDIGMSPVTAASFMGNFRQESGSAFDPFLPEGASCAHPGSFSPTVIGCGFGIIQWTNHTNTPNGRRYQMMTKMAQHFGISEITATNPARTPENNDKALLWQLNYLREEDPAGWDSLLAAMNAEEYVVPPDENIDGAKTVPGRNCGQFHGNPTGFGTVLVYHNRKVNSADVDGRECTPPYGDMRRRIQGAVDALEEFGGSGVNCPGDSSDWGDIDAISQAFRDQVGTGCYTSPQAPGYSFCHCDHGCTTLPAWFANEYTTIRWTNTIGGGGVGAAHMPYALSAINPELQVTDYPVAPALYGAVGGTPGWNSGAGTVGVVISVDGDVATVLHTWKGICGTGPQVEHNTVLYDINKVRFLNIPPEMMVRIGQ